MLTLGELVLRRKLEQQENKLTGVIYKPGQHAALITGDDAIISFVDTGGWAVQLFVTFQDGEWVMKTDGVVCVNPYGLEVRRAARSTRLSDDCLAALATAKKRKPTTKEKP